MTELHAWRWRRLRFALGGAALLAGTLASADELVPLRGSPPVARFAPDLLVTPQNFDVVQGHDGLVYLANTDGVLVFDGEGWELIRLPNRELVRSLAVAGDGRILVGGYNCFGYLEPDRNGRLRYVELSTQFAPWLAGREFADIWGIAPAPDGIYFLALRELFFWRPDAPPLAWHHPGRFGAIQVPPDGGRALLQFRGEGFRARHGDEWLPLPGTSSERNLVGQLLPLTDGGWLLAEAVDPGWRRLTADGTIEPLAMPADLPAESHSLRAAVLADGSLVFNGRDGVVQIVDAQRRTRYAFRLESGFLSGLHRRPGGGFLVSSDQAVHAVEWPGAWTVLGAEHGATGALQGLRSWNQQDYLLSSSGVLRIQTSAGTLPRFVAQSWPSDTYYDLLGLDAQTVLLAGSHRLLRVQDGTLTALGEGPIYPRLLQPSEHWPGRVWVGTENGLRHLDSMAGTPRLSTVTALGVDARVNSVVERGPRELWFGTERHGVWRVQLDAAGSFQQIERVDRSADTGLAMGVIAEARLAPWTDGQMLVSTRAGFFRFAADRGRFVADTLDGLESLRPAEHALYLALAPDGTRWAHGLGSLFRQTPDGPWLTVPIQALRRGAFVEQRFDTAGRLQMVDSQALLLHDPAGAAASHAAAATVLLRQVDRIDADGTEWPLALAPAVAPEFTQSDFGIRFRFALPELSASRQVRYRGRLVGYEAEFSDWSEARGYTYSRLSPGDYRLEVEARDSAGHITAIAPWSLRIVPPWHARGWVLATTALVGLLVLYAGVRWQVQRRIRRLHAQRTRLEQLVAERTSELAAANARLTQMAHLDGLTGIANRRRLDAALILAWERARAQSVGLAALAIDVDHFKRFNDSHGHLAGDEILRQLAQVLTGTLRRPGELLARYGGEEFVALLPDGDQASAVELAEAMRAAVATAGLGITVSIGVAETQPQANDHEPTRLIAAADAALYAAKRAGRDCVKTAPVAVDAGGSATAT